MVGESITAINVGNFSSLLTFVDETIGNQLFGIGTMLMIFIIILLSTNQPMDKSFAFGSFAMFSLGLLFYFLGIVSGLVVVITILMLVSSFVWMQTRRREEEGNI